MSSDPALWSATYGLYRLLMDRETGEDRYQLFFESNPVALKVLGCSDVKSYEKRSGRLLPFDSEKNFRPEPDFLGLDFRSGTLSVIELKTPFVGAITTSRSDGKRTKFKADAESYLSQAMEYVESIRGRENARASVASEFGVGKISSYRAVLIYGLSSENKPEEVARLCACRSPACEIIFFDDLLDNLATTYALSRKDVESRPGWCFVFHAQIAKSQAHDRAYIASYGGSGENSISVIVEGEFLVFECIDAENQVHRLFSRVERDVPIYVRFEFSNDANGIYMSLNVNNREQDLRVGSRVLSFNPDVFSFVLGAGPRGESGAEFLMMEHYSVNKTIAIKDKLGSYHYFERELTAELKGIYFLPENYMIRSPDGALIQEHEHLRPRYRAFPRADA